MSIPILGMIVSAGGILVLVLFFSYETKKGTRIAIGLRQHLDKVLSKIAVACCNFFGHLSRDIFRQSLHFSFHTFLSVILHFLDGVQKRIELLLRSNRALARKARREPVVRTARNKLDDIADHKAAVALSDEEKQKHKDKILEG